MASSKLVSIEKIILKALIESDTNHEEFRLVINPLSATPTKWSNALLPTNCLSVFDHFVGLALKGLMRNKII